MQIRPYGDTLDDGAVQLSFTLPMSNSEKSREAAKRFVLKHGFKRCEITSAEALADNFTMFVVYAWTKLGIDSSEVKDVVSAAPEIMNFDEVNLFIKEHVKRPIVIVGACTGSDAHTVGIDAIMNMKGYNHHFGLERYPMVRAYNLGAQVENQHLIEYAIKVKADAILVSQIVNQKDMHLENMKEFISFVKDKKVRKQFLLIAGGPHLNHKMAKEAGFDAGFGRGSYAEHVATFVARKLAGKSK
ncbi:MAG: cobalamin-dependent protein [Fibrobacteria bacterium]|nr:cobalamin-dependent protein [Fibrobacteria bacterium]